MNKHVKILALSDADLIQYENITEHSLLINKTAGIYVTAARKLLLV